VDARAPDRERLERLVSAIGLDPGPIVEPTAMAAEVREALRAVLEERGLPVIELASGAGHDAGVLARAGVASGMLFVRSLNGGVSHSPDEESSREDVALAVDVLTDGLRRLTA
jgi:acetylornithine deacetylase/succinyl-diaminopimelate desuccinylase-like protein